MNVKFFISAIEVVKIIIKEDAIKINSLYLNLLEK